MSLRPVVAASCLALLGLLAPLRGQTPDPAPFGAEWDKLDGFATGAWWEKEWSAPRDTWMAELRDVPRERALAFALYTVEAGVLKLSAQCYPLRPEEPRTVHLEILADETWKEIATAEVVYPGWSAHFRVEGWDDTRDVRYRARLGELSRFEGRIRRDPREKEAIVVGLLSCNSNHDRSPRTDLVAHLGELDPDLLFFAGDQSYDHRQHTAAWLLFGEQFGSLIADRPTVTIPDDHDVGHGNLWGEAGAPAPPKTNGDHGGYVLPAAYVKMVERCQTWHLPDAFDPTPVLQGIGVYYTRLRVGGVDFAILEDRKFKTGPGGEIPQRGPRPDHVNDPSVDPAFLEKEGLELLGARQLAFLEAWGRDWSGAAMKCVLSQTNFCGAVTHHGKPTDRLIADLDCNGWPRSGRDTALRAIRRAWATHLCGDQHLAVVTWHGIDAFRDGPWSFCGPAIQNDYYGRWWKPDEGSRSGGPYPGTSQPWTGDYHDGFGNRFTLLAYANPDRPAAGFEDGNGLGDGFGIARFSKDARRITFEAYRRGEELRSYPGWPVEVQQRQNDGRAVVGTLPELRFDRDDPVVEVRDDATDERLYTVRVRGRSFAPPVYGGGRHRVYVGADTADRLVFLGAPGEGTIEVPLGTGR